MKMRMNICRVVALIASICVATNFILPNNEIRDVKLRKINVERKELNSRYTSYFEESELYSSDDQKTVRLKAKNSYNKNDNLFDKVSLVENDNRNTERDENVGQNDELETEEICEDNIGEDYDEDYIEEHKELGEKVFDNKEDGLEVDYDCRFDMEKLTFKFEAELLSEEGKSIEKKVINTDAIITKNGGLDACISINGEEYMMSDYEDYNPVDECSIMDVIKVVAAYLAVAETAEQIKATSNYKYNKKLESDGKGVKKGYLIYSQSNSTTKNRKAANYRFGFTKFASVGCEVAAAYNMANQLGSTESLSQTIYYFEGYAIEFSIGWGYLGSDPLEINRYLNKRGFKYNKFTNYKSLKTAVDGKKSCKIIMSRWNEKKSTGLHTFYVKKEDYGKHYGYNWHYTDYTESRSGKYKSLNSFNDGSGFIVGYLVWK